MADSISLVGLDVHAAQTHAAVLDLATGELRRTRLRGSPGEVVSFLAQLPGPVRAVYEAGPTGFGLARSARALGIDVGVVAPGKIPRAPGDRVKTDKRDAERLVRLLAAGELHFAYVPTVADEQFRDLIRAIEDVRGDLMRARHRLSKMLLRREIRWEGPGRTWTQGHMGWLRSLRFDDACSQATLTDYLSAVEMLVARRSALLVALEQAIPDTSHAATIAALRCFRGIDTLSAAGLCAEIGDWSRFSPKQLSGFLGVVPSERTSDTKRRQGGITKTGSAPARRLLVEAAHHYRHHPAVGDTLAKRQDGQDPRVIAVSWRAQRRLNQRWR
ncbi:MAG: IS110 family transposase, partial [Solirubrobacteraceae bacterium]